MLKYIFLLHVVLLGFMNSHAQKTFIYCGNLLDVKQGAFQKERTIVIEKNKIVRIDKGYTTAQPTDQTIDLKNKYVLPGLIDMHVHLENETNPNGTLQRFTLNQADIALQSTRFAYKTLMAGFTTVRDLGGSGINISLRNAINQGTVIGPRIFTSGKSIASTGGHADPTNGYKREIQGDPTPKEGVANGIAECVEAVRHRYKEGADIIKITATGGVLSLAKDGSNPQFTEEEVRAIVQTAQDYGFKVAAHAHGTEGMKRAIRGGVHSIEHGSYMDDEAIGLMKKMGTYYVPTLLAGKTVADSAKVPNYYSPIVVPKALEIGPIMQNTFSKAYKAGVKIAFGTDSGVSVHGLNAIEFQLMVEAGMPPLEAIRSATMYAADLLGMPQQLGVLEANMLADIIAVSQNPLENISSLRQIKFVMKNGVTYKNEP